MKTPIIFLLLIISLCLSQTSLGQLRVDSSGRYLMTAEGEPFFWLGDTAWELFHRLSEAEARIYLKQRASLGFNVIQAVVLAELDGLTVPNANGDLPLHKLNPTKPNEAYFRHVDAVIGIADSLGMYIGLLPTWGDKFNLKWGVGPIVFNKKNALEYGRFIGARYRDKRIIWILGGDRNPEIPEHKEIVTAMAKGIRTQVGDRQLITFHPQGGFLSTDFFNDSEWLDLNLFQSGHWEKDHPNFLYTEKGYTNSPTRPIVDSEPCYEDHPINWKPEQGWYTDFDTRRAGYWSVLSGAAGHTFGNHNIWQMWQSGREPISSARTSWQEALYYPGAYHAGLMRTIFEQIDWQDLIPNQNLITNTDTITKYTCRFATSNQTAVAYTPYGDSFSLDLSQWNAPLTATWIDPRNGRKISLAPAIPAAQVVFDPPFDPKEGNDWLLVLQK